MRVDVRQVRRGTLRLAPERPRAAAGSPTVRTRSARVRAVRPLLDGNVIGGGPLPRGLNRRKQTGIGNDADDFGHGLLATRPVETLADCLLPWPDRSRHRLGDDRHGRRALAVLSLGEQPTLRETHLHHPEKRGIDGIAQWQAIAGYRPFEEIFPGHFDEAESSPTPSAGSG